MLGVTRREFVAGSAAVVATTTSGIAGRTIRRQGAGQAGAPAKAHHGLAIVHTNDTHGYDVREDESMGMAAVPALRDSLESEGYEVLILDAGDALQGDTFVNLFKGETAIELMNAVGYHAMAIGNHEFDYGQDALVERMNQATFPFLSANVTREESGELVFEPNTTFKLKSGLKVGVFGLTTPETKTKATPLIVEGLKFAAGEELYSIAQKEADTLRADGCDFVIMLAHLGEIDNRAPNRAVDVVGHVTGVDIVIDGHDHKEEQHVLPDAAGKGVLVVETGFYTHALGLITYEDGKLASTLLHPEEFKGEDAQMAAIVGAVKEKVDEALSLPIATTPYFLSGKYPDLRYRETNLGDLICDSFLWAAQNAGATDASCAVLGGGSIRDNIEAGDITVDSILSVLPYMSPVVTIKIPGSALLEALEAASQVCPEPLGAFAHVAGITYEINTTVPYVQGELYPDSTYHAPAKPGGRVTIHTVDGEPFDAARIYTVVTNDFIATGGDTYYAFSRHEDSICDIAVPDYQAIVDYITDAMGGTVSADYADENGEGRVIVIE